MNAGAFTFVDYGCQMVPFYLCAWFVMKLGASVDLQGSLAYASILSGFLFVVIVVTASAAMARHAVRYLPWGADQSSGSNRPFERSANDSEGVLARVDGRRLAKRTSFFCLFKDIAGHT